MKNLRQVSLCLLIKDNKVLLGMKKRGFGSGKYNGVGGKKNPGETIDDTARRETFEEVGVKIKDLQQVGVIEFYFEKNNEFDQEVVVFISKDWDGDLIESDEIKPFWFDFDQIPYDEMWADDIYWLPKVLAGEKIKASFTFDEKENLTNYKVDSI